MNVEFTLKLRIYRSLKSLICFKWILKKFSTTLNTQFNYLKYSRSLPLKATCDFMQQRQRRKIDRNPDVKKILYHLKTCLCNMYVQRSIFMDIWQNGYIIVKVWCNFIAWVSCSSLDIGPWTWKFIFAFCNICKSLKGVFAEDWKGLYGEK